MTYGRLIAAWNCMHHAMDRMSRTMTCVDLTPNGIRMAGHRVVHVRTTQFNSAEVIAQVLRLRPKMVFSVAPILLALLFATPAVSVGIRGAASADAYCCWWPPDATYANNGKCAPEAKAAGFCAETNSSNVFVPDYVLEMSAKASADKTLVKCQDNYPPECSALCARRMDTYDGAIYNNGRWVAYCG